VTAPGLAKTAFLCGRAGRRDDVLGQARELIPGVERQHVALLVGQHALAELGAEDGQAFADLGEPPAGRGVEPGAGTAECHEVAVQHPRLLGVEAALVAPERLDPPKQRWFM